MRSVSIWWCVDVGGEGFLRLKVGALAAPVGKFRLELFGSLNGRRAARGGASRLVPPLWGFVGNRWSGVSFAVGLHKFFNSPPSTTSGGWKECDSPCVSAGRPSVLGRILLVIVLGTPERRGRACPGWLQSYLGRQRPPFVNVLSVSAHAVWTFTCRRLNKVSSTSNIIRTILQWKVEKWSLQTIETTSDARWNLPHLIPEPHDFKYFWNVSLSRWICVGNIIFPLKSFVAGLLCLIRIRYLPNQDSRHTQFICMIN